MPAAFSQIMRALEADGFRQTFWAILFGVGLAGAVLGWGFWGRVNIYEVSRQARLEVESEVHPVAASVGGRVVATHLVLGQKVQAGDLLLELDAESQKLQLAEEQARVQALRRRIEAMQEEIRTEDEAWPKEQKAAQATIEEARSRQKEAEAAARFAGEEGARLKRLFAEGLTSKTDLERGEAEAEQKQAAARALTLAVSKMESEKEAKEKVHQARSAKLKSEMVSLEGQVGTGTETIKRCEYEINSRRIVAPVAGQLAETANLQPGSFVQSGDKIGAVLPSGELKAVAHFPPLAALGRIRSGHPARLRLDGFPWTQYGSVAANVTRVANEPREGTVRVELAVDPRSAPRIPFQHGLPGSLEVTVERVAPFTLLLRTVGKELTGTPQPQSASNVRNASQ